MVGADSGVRGLLCSRPSHGALIISCSSSPIAFAHDTRRHQDDDNVGSSSFFIVISLVTPHLVVSHLQTFPPIHAQRALLLNVRHRVHVATGPAQARVRLAHDRGVSTRRGVRIATTPRSFVANPTDPQDVSPHRSNQRPRALPCLEGTQYPPARIAPSNAEWPVPAVVSERRRLWSMISQHISLFFHRYYTSLRAFIRTQGHYHHLSLCTAYPVCAVCIIILLSPAIPAMSIASVPSSRLMVALPTSRGLPQEYLDSTRTPRGS